jgi:hypothetical protein
MAISSIAFGVVFEPKPIEPKASSGMARLSASMAALRCICEAGISREHFPQVATIVSPLLNCREYINKDRKA